MKRTIALLLTLFMIVARGFADQDTAEPKMPQVQHTPLEQKSPPELPTILPFEDIVEPQETSDDHFMKGFLHMLASLGLIIVLLLIVSWFFKRMMNTRQQQLNTTSHIKIIERRALSPKATIYLLEIKGQGIIAGESANGLTLLANYKPDVSTEKTFNP